MSDASLDALEAWATGHEAFQGGDFAKASSCLRQAITIAKLVPPDADFDKIRLLADCYARITQALGIQGEHQESLAWADEALPFFKSYNISLLGEFLIPVMMNKGASLAALGRLHEALAVLRLTRELLNEYAHLGGFKAMCDQNIDAITKKLQETEGGLSRGRISSRTLPKKWWQIWK